MRRKEDLVKEAEELEKCLELTFASIDYNKIEPDAIARRIEFLRMFTEDKSNG